MASQDERNKIRALNGVPSHPSVIPNMANRWHGHGAPKRLGEPGSYSNPTKPTGNSFVKNPYSTISQPNRTNPTANVTFLSGISSGSRTRNIGSRKRMVSTPLGRDKGKGKATDPRPSSSREIIILDDCPPSTDDLDIIDALPPTKSPYSDFQKEATGQTDGVDGPTSGASLVADGENTALLRRKIDGINRVLVHEGDHEPQKQETSSIGSFSDDGIQVKEMKTPSVKQLVAKFNEIGSREQGPAASDRGPVIDLRKTAKTRMQPKPSNKSNTLKFLPTIRRDVSSNPSRLGSISVRKKAPVPLPVSAIAIGEQQIHDYRIIVFDDKQKTISFEGNSNEPTCFIELTPLNFHLFQFTKPLDEEVHAPIFHFKSLSTGKFNSLQSQFGGIFKPGGSGNQGQITIKFDTSAEQWNSGTYFSITEKMSSLIKAETLRASGSRSVWNAVSNSAKFRSGDSSDLIDLPDNLDNSAEPVQDTLSIESSLSPSSKKRQANQLLKYRNSPVGDTTQKRPSSSRREIPTAEEVIVTEPPSKRRRVEEPQAVRRSARQQEKSPAYDADEVILVYPYGVPGAVNVTAGDLARLQPDEFLNDTLIEFGFKAWLKELEATDPEIASQVYVFNSFFYKKLNKRNIKEGYDSVRKWTSKIDIFSKKYVIVPINEHLHWYLAIIYEPEHVLQTPPPSQNPHSHAVTRKQTRESHVAQEKVDQPEPQVSADDDVDDGANSENEVEKLAFSTSCSITITDENLSTMSPASQLKVAFVEDPVSAEREKSLKIAPGSPMKIDSDLPKDVSEQPTDSAMSDTTMGSGTHTPVKNPNDSQPIRMPLQEEVTPARFYRKSFMNQAEVHVSKSRKKTRESSREPVIVGDSRNVQSRIFILDSLGNRHPQAMKQLSRWLELEAMDKKKLESVTPAITKMVPVPVQPNYCDCGLYILHFAKTFMSNPQHFCQIIMTKDRPTLPERQTDWRADNILTMREELRAQILSFSDDWHQRRAARGEKQQQARQEEEEGEDSDVAIVEHVKAPGKKGKSIKATRTKT